MFKEKIEIVVGDIVQRDNFVFADILPAGVGQSIVAPENVVV